MSKDTTVTPELFKAIIAQVEAALKDGTLEIDIPDTAINASVAAKVANLEARISHLTDELLAMKQAINPAHQAGERVDVTEAVKPEPKAKAKK